MQETAEAGRTFCHTPNVAKLHSMSQERHGRTWAGIMLGSSNPRFQAGSGYECHASAVSSENLHLRHFLRNPIFTKESAWNFTWRTEHQVSAAVLSAHQHLLAFMGLKYNQAYIYTPVPTKKIHNSLSNMVCKLLNVGHKGNSVGF